MANIGGDRAARRATWTFAALLLVGPLPVSAADGDPAQRGLWRTLIDQGRAQGLPVRFLERIPPDFVQFEFADLRAFAAEYHPEDRRLLLNRALSFNAAAGTMKPLARLPSRDVSTLFHELMHVYLDYLASLPETSQAGEAAARLLAFARQQQQCRYQVVLITPVQQRKAQTETRVLTERESWEALHETWAVFVGWAIWTQRELQMKAAGEAVSDVWVRRVRKADRQAEWVGYYEPEDPSERAVARKRYLAAVNRITPQEVSMLLSHVLEYSNGRVAKAVASMESQRPPVPGNPPCS